MISESIFVVGAVGCECVFAEGAGGSFADGGLIFDVFGAILEGSRVRLHDRLSKRGRELRIGLIVRYQLSLEGLRVRV